MSEIKLVGGPEPGITLLIITILWLVEVIIWGLAILQIIKESRPWNSKTISWFLLIIFCPFVGAISYLIYTKFKLLKE